MLLKEIAHFFKHGPSTTQETIAEVTPLYHTGTTEQVIENPDTERNHRNEVARLMTHQG